MNKKRIYNPVLWICLILFFRPSPSISQENGTEQSTDVLLDSTFSVNLGPIFPNVRCHCLVTCALQDGSIYNFQFSTASPRPHVFSVIDTAERPSSEFIFDDLNFDGYRDLRVAVEFYRNPVYSAWLFDPDSIRFQAWEKYPDNVGELTLDSINKTMSFFNYSFSAAARQIWTQIYGVSGTVPFLTREEVSTDYSVQESFADPDSTITRTDVYSYDFSIFTPLLDEHTQTIVTTKNNKEFVTTLLERRVAGKMSFIKKTQTTREAK